MKEKKRSSAVLVHLRSYDSRLQESRVTLALVYSIRARSFLSVVQFRTSSLKNGIHAEQSHAVSDSRSTELLEGTQLSASWQSKQSAFHSEFTATFKT